MVDFNRFEDADPQETTGVAGVHRLRAAGSRSRSRAFPVEQHDRSCAPVRRVLAVQRDDGLSEHDSGQSAAVVSGRPRDRAAHRGLHSLERDGDGRAGESPQLGIRRPHRDLCVGRDAVRSRFQSFLARQRGQASRRPHLYAGTRVAGHLRARVPRRAAERRPAESVPPGSRRRRVCRRIRTRG